MASHGAALQSRVLRFKERASGHLAIRHFNRLNFLRNLRFRKKTFPTFDDIYYLYLYKKFES